MISSIVRVVGSQARGIGRGHLGEPGPQVPDVATVVVEGPAGRRPQGVLEEGEDMDGQIEAAFLFGLGGAPPIVAEHHRGLGVGRLDGPGQHRSVGVAPGQGPGIDAVGADQDGHLHLAPADGQGGGVDHGLGVVAAGGGHHDLVGLDAQFGGHRKARVEVVPGQRIDHPQ